MLLSTSKEIKDFNNIFVIGDIHGCFQQFAKMYEYLQTVLTTDDILLFLGDYIDRGSANSKTLDLLCDIQQQRPTTIFLKGNHEDMFLDFIGLGGQYGSMSIYNGSHKLFKEYKLDRYIKTNAFTGESYIVDISKPNLIKKIPEKHLTFLKNLTLSAESEKLLFVHAGIDPAKNLKTQTTENLLWIREDFTNWISKWHISKTIIHGHTICEEPIFDLPYRINIDTGCFKNGILTCLQIKDETLLERSSIIQVNKKLEVINK